MVFEISIPFRFSPTEALGLSKLKTKEKIEEKGIKK